MELDGIFSRLTRRIPRLERVVPKPMEDGRLLLQFKDRPFAQPIQARYASDGTLKMLSYLVLLFDPDPVPLLGIEEPENFLHPSLLFELAEECQSAVAHTQVLVTTHSPQFIDALKPKQVRILQRSLDGFTSARTADEVPRVREQVAEGARLGDLWMQGYLDDQVVK